MNFDFHSERRLNELHDEQTADTRLRGYLVRAMREELELPPEAQAMHRACLHRSLTELNRRITRRAYLLDELGWPTSPTDRVTTVAQAELAKSCLGDPAVVDVRGQIGPTRRRTAEH